jgi:hypothetical protein
VKDLAWRTQSSGHAAIRRYPTSSEHIVTCFAAYNVRFEAWPVPKHLFAVVALLVLTLFPHYALAGTSSREGPTTVSLRGIIFSKPIVLSPGEIRDLTTTLQSRSHQFSLATESEKFADHADALVQLAYQDHGYFLAKATSEVIPVKSNSGSLQVDLFVSVNEGHQYRLLDLRWKNISRFSEQQLVDLMPVHPGEIFSRSKIAKGLDEARKLYRSHGYINFTCIPNTVFDEAQHDVALETGLREQPQPRAQHVLYQVFPAVASRGYSRRLRKMENRPKSSHRGCLPFIGIQSFAAEADPQVVATLTGQRQIESLAASIPSDIF